MSVGTKVRLRPKRLDDTREDYCWQTDPELSDLDAVSPLRLSYTEYVEEYHNQLRHPSAVRCNFAIETLDGRHIGNCVYYNIDREKSEAEVGIMVGNRDYWNQGYGADAMTALVDYIFRHTDFKRLYLKTLEKNLRAQRSFRKVGFNPSGHMERDGYKFVLMEMTRSQWLELNTRNKKPARDDLPSFVQQRQ
ncbi:MAG: GNAT family N-acetyltransferase [Dehalococcoidia bacterium]|nr:GNAT family N-acetyltransferase [Dehalococcoidia bacterium]